jgi:hypothetical protein
MYKHELKTNNGKQFGTQILEHSPILENNGYPVVLVAIKVNKRK